MQSVSSPFLAAEVAPTSSPLVNFKASWTKAYGVSSGIFTIGTSTIQGTDIIPGDGYVPNDFNLFVYEDDTSYVQSVVVDRFFDQPTSVARGSLDITLDDSSGYFDPQGTSAIKGLVTIGKPLQVKFGYGAEFIDLFNGSISDYPTFKLLAGTVEIFALDLLDIVANQFTTIDIMLTNVTVDQVLVSVFAQLGIVSSNYSFGTGATIIPSVAIPAGTLIGQVFKDLMVAEGGYLWCDETGKFRFLPRNVNPYAITNFDISDSYLIDKEDLITSYIINTCRITGAGNIAAVYTDIASGKQFGLQTADLSSPYIQTQEQAAALAYLYVKSNSSEETFHILHSIGLPHLQLGDIVTWHSLSYVIIRIKTIYNTSQGFISEFTIKRYTLGNLFTIGTSVINGVDQIAP